MPDAQREHPDQPIASVVARLRERLGAGAFDAVEYWDADLCAVGIAAPRAPTRLVYISVCDKPAGRFDVALEQAPEGEPQGGRAPASASAHHVDVDFDTLCDIVARHLGASAR
jgi:hypothetical protein